MRWSSHLVPLVDANLGPFVQILNIIEGHFPMSSRFFKDFNKERGVAASIQFLGNHLRHLNGGIKSVFSKIKKGGGEGIKVTVSPQFIGIQ